VSTHQKALLINAIKLIAIGDEFREPCASSPFSWTPLQLLLSAVGLGAQRQLQHRVDVQLNCYLLLHASLHPTVARLSVPSQRWKLHGMYREVVLRARITMTSLPRN